MPTYQYECRACEHSFEQFQRMAEEPLVKCPNCRKNKLFRVIGLLAISTGPKTLGGIADRNAARMSDDEKAELKAKQKTVREFLRPLPENMSVVEKPTEAPWYKQNQTVPNDKLAKLDKRAKKKYIETGVAT